MTTRGPLAAPTAAAGGEAAGHGGRNTARRVTPLFRPYRGQVAVVVGLIVLTSASERGGDRRRFQSGGRDGAEIHGVGHAGWYLSSPWFRRRGG
jgi:hypothetical protein